MAIKYFLLATILMGLCFFSCKKDNQSKSRLQAKDSLLNSKTNKMHTYISIFEIPATEISRAIDFYQTILDIKIEKIDMPDMQIGVLPYEGQMVTGVIIKADGYKPSSDGVTIYLNGGDNLQVILDKVEKYGGKITIPKTLHADESGYFAIFLDSEGNKIGLHSPN